MKRSLAVLIKASLLLVIAGSLLLAQQQIAAPPTQQFAQQAATEKDHQRMMPLLNINTTGPSWQQQVLAKGRGYASLIPTSIKSDKSGVSPTPTVTPTPFATTPRPTLTLAPTPKPINGLTYFGYWGSSGDGITFDETSAYSNLVWIGDTNISRLSTISQHSGMKAIIYPYNTFFDTNFRLRSDYQIRWNALATQIKPYVDNKTVIAINPLDEPMWNASQNGISSSDMKSVMESINKSIKQTFPGMTTVMIESYAMVNSSMITPTGYDWIGFDCYGSWDYCNGHSIPEYARIIKSKLSSNQRLILVPDAIYQGLAPSVSDQNLIASRAEQYYQLAVSQGAVAFMPFYYISFDANHTVARDMPIVKSKYEELGRRILGLAPNVTPTLTITPTPTPNITPTPTPVSGGPSGYVFCASENQFCAFSNTRSVAYGANGQFNYLTLTGGTNCSNTVFNDPIYGVAKACYTKEVKGSSPTPAVTPTPFPPTPTPTSGVSVTPVPNESPTRSITSSSCRW